MRSRPETAQVRRPHRERNGSRSRSPPGTSRPGSGRRTRRNGLRARQASVIHDHRAQPTCVDGIAAYWLAPRQPGTAAPNPQVPKYRPVSTKPLPVMRRGYAIGKGQYPRTTVAMSPTGVEQVRESPGETTCRCRAAPFLVLCRCTPERSPRAQSVWVNAVRSRASGRLARVWLPSSPAG